MAFVVTLNQKTKVLVLTKLSVINIPTQKPTNFYYKSSVKTKGRHRVFPESVGVPEDAIDADVKIKVETDLDIPNSTSNAHTKRITTIKPKAKGEELERHRSTVREIIIFTNATPIKSKGTLGYACCFCKNQFLDPVDLKTHNLNAHDVDEKSTFMKGNDLSKFCVKLDVTFLQCVLCKQDLKFDNLFDHLVLQHDKKLFPEVKTKIVPFSFEDGLKCYICRNSFHNYRCLVEHMNIHYRNFVCIHCGAGFVSQNILFQHLRTHKTGSFKCDYCTKVFETMMKKRAHERVVHTHTNVLNKCRHCSETFKDYWQREKHLAAVHNIVAEYKCQACDRTFPHQKGLRVHTKRDHLMERPHACSECDKKFFTAKKLKEHMVKHTGSKEFECEVCRKRYGRKKTLNQHMRVHEKFRRYRCEYCNQGFVQRASWQGHVRTKHDRIV